MVCVLVGTAAELSLGFNMQGLPYLISSSCRCVLLLKSFLVAVLIALGGVNRFIILPRLDRYGPGHWTETTRYRARLHRVITAEVIAGSFVLPATSLLCHLSPEG